VTDRESGEERRDTGDRAEQAAGGPDPTRTELQSANQALRESEARLRILVAELQHRVRDSLALLKSITARTADSSDSIEEMTAHLVGRIEAFARVQSVVTRHPDRGVDLAGLIADEMLVHAVREGEQLTLKGPEIALRPKAAETISLALHELATNAIKHGSLGNGGGRIGVSWKTNGSGDGGMVGFTWTEEGANGGLSEPEHEGFGMELLTRILPYDLGAKTNIEFRRQGLQFQMELPVRHLASQDEMPTP